MQVSWKCERPCCILDFVPNQPSNESTLKNTEQEYKSNTVTTKRHVKYQWFQSFNG